MIVKIVWECDECAKQAETQSTHIPRGWLSNFGEFCRTCAPIVSARRSSAMEASVARACRQMDIETGEVSS